MQKKPEFDYSSNSADSRLIFASNLIRKKYPILSKIKENEFEEFSFFIFDICKNFIGTESGSARGLGFGGSHAEIRCATAAAMGIAIEFDDDEVRRFNNSTLIALVNIFDSNDHLSLIMRCAGYERNATNSKMDLFPIAQELSECIWEIIDDEETDQVQIHPVVAEFAEVIGEVTTTKRFITGNRSRDRVRRKPVERAVKSLFGEAI